LVDLGRPECYLYFVETGRLAVREADPSGQRQMQRLVERGRYLGFYGLVTGRPGQITATAEKDSTLLAVPLHTVHARLLPGIESRTLPENQILFRQGDPEDFLYLVETGKVAEMKIVPTGLGRVHRYAGPGEYVGRYALLTGQPYRITAITEEETSLLVVPLRHLQPILFAHEDWHSWFFRTDVAARLRAVPLFMGLSDWDVYSLADAVEEQEYGEGDTIYAPGDRADSFYVINQGQVIHSVPAMAPGPTGSPSHYLATGNFFGQSALAGAQPRKTTAIARKQTRLYRIPNEVLEELRDTHAGHFSQELVHVDIVGRLLEVPVFHDLKDCDMLTEADLQLLAGYVSLVYYAPGQIIARQGEPAISLMVLDEGEAVVRRQTGLERPRPVRYLKVQREAPASGAPAPLPKSESFGDHALLADEMRGATVEVTEPSVWIVLSREDFQRFLDDVGLTLEDLKQALQESAPADTATPLREEPSELPYKVRRHWIVPASQILPLVMVMILVAMLITADLMSGLTGGVRALLMWGGILFLVLFAFWALYRFFDWWNDTYEVTSQAVIHSEKHLFLSEDRYEIPLQQIQNVNILVDVIGRLLGYGNVAIDTAAATGQIHFTVIPEPAYVQELIQRASAQARSGLQFQRQESIRQQLEDQFYPERLKPAIPESVLIQPEEPPPPRSRFNLFGLFAAWLPRFEMREDGKVIWRKHWINLLQRTGVQALAMVLAIYLLLAFALAFATESLGIKPVELPPVPLFGFQGWLFLVLAVLGFFAVLWFVYQYVDWRNDVYIVTDNEVIDVERELAIFPFFFFYTESRRQASLANVQFVDLNIPSPLAMVLRYGNVIVQTAGAEGTLDFLWVSKPRHVHDEIVRRLAAYQDRERERELQERWGDMPQWFETFREIERRAGSQSN
jgi:CRP-like cAMP-binding protein/uncharacterized membrane protein YdbT with pleckstrin-like domain